MNHLILDNLTVFIGETCVVKTMSLSLSSASTHLLMGPNGSGKSSLAYALMGHPRYTVSSGDIVLNGESLKDLSADKRANRGLFLAVQHPYEIPGVSVLSFLMHAYQSCKGKITTAEMKEKISTAFAMVGLDSALMDRSLNDGFSGGEKKRLELAQMLILEPSVIILDEIDSGLDIDALAHVREAMNVLKNKNSETIFLIITHSPALAKMLAVDRVHIMVDGSLAASGDQALLEDITKSGYEDYRKQNDRV